MKKIVAILLALLCLASVACAEGSIVISGLDSNSVALGEKISIPKVVDVTVHSISAGEYALSVNAWNRPEDEKFETPRVDFVTYKNGNGYWGDTARYKFKKNENDKDCYAFMYADIGAGLKASAEEYQLLDIRLSLLNTMMLPLNVQDKIQMKLVYGDGYEFENTYIRMEEADPNGNPGEWLCEPTDIPMLVERITHFVFEVPNVVLTTDAPLKAIITVSGEDYEFTIR